MNKVNYEVIFKG